MAEPKLVYLFCYEHISLQVQFVWFAGATIWSVGNNFFVIIYFENICKLYSKTVQVFVRSISKRYFPVVIALSTVSWTAPNVYCGQYLLIHRHKFRLNDPRKTMRRARRVRDDADAARPINLRLCNNITQRSNACVCPHDHTGYYVDCSLGFHLRVYNRVIKGPIIGTKVP